MSNALIGAPTSLGAFAPGQEQAPRALREAGFTADADLGDIPLRRWSPDREHRRAQNGAGVAEAAREVAERVEAAIRAGHRPVVLGGVLVAGAGFAGLTVTEHNPLHGAEDGSDTAALAARLGAALNPS
jgi:arginase